MSDFEVPEAIICSPFVARGTHRTAKFSWHSGIVGSSGAFSALAGGVPAAMSSTPIRLFTNKT